MNPRVILLLLLAFCVNRLHAQVPPLYINIVSHNEPGDSLHRTNEFNDSKVRVLQFANLVKTKDARWNLGTCDGFVEGALTHETGGSNPNDILQTLTGPNYATWVELDPRNKNDPGRTVADLVYLIDSCGAVASNNLSGFIYASTTPTQPDWFRYEDTILGLTYIQSWKADLIWGAGSIPPHTNDLNDYGVWRPDTVTQFYQDNPARSLWYQGNGCQPVQGLDSMENEQVVIAQIQGAVDSIQNGLWPPNKFYCYSVTINQSQFGPMLFAKMGNVMDAVNALGSNKIVWATTSAKHDAFLTWSNNGGTYSQWGCGMAPVGVAEPLPIATSAFPNPFQDQLRFGFADDGLHEVILYTMWGQETMRATLQGKAALDCKVLTPGVYLAVVDGRDRMRLVKQ